MKVEKSLTHLSRFYKCSWILTRFYLTEMRKIDRNKVALSIWDTMQDDLESNTKGDKDLQRE